eukprot:3560923-Prymnesium_polylepis.1
MAELEQGPCQPRKKGALNSLRFGSNCWPRLGPAAAPLPSLPWPMAYDAPGGGIGRYARPAPSLRCRVWHEVRADERTIR